MSKNINCWSCANRVGDSYCTMTKDMNKATYKKCSGYKLSVPKKKKVYEQRNKPVSNIRNTEADYKGQFGKFLKNGGSYSERTGEYVGVTKLVKN